jgi:hypothetical protein
MSGPLSNLDAPCGKCGDRLGDHTLDKLQVCTGSGPDHYLPFEEVDPVLEDFRKRFSIEDPDLLIADNAVVKAGLIDGQIGGVAGFKLPVVIHEFAIGRVGQQPLDVARVMFLGDAESIRGYGRLVRDNSNAAANRSEGKQPRGRR